MHPCCGWDIAQAIDICYAGAAYLYTFPIAWCWSDLEPHRALYWLEDPILAPVQVLTPPDGASLFYSDKGCTWLMHLCISLDPSGSTVLLFGLVCPPPHLSAIVGLPARQNKLQTSKTFGVCRTLMPQCTCIDGPFCPHFAGARAKGKRSFRTD